MSQYGFYFNADACYGCKACVMACKDKNDLPLGVKFRRVYDYAGGEWSVKEDGTVEHTGVFAYSVSASCMHCESPACVENCPAGAMVKREDGIVYVDKSLCIACGTCSKVCPYGQPVVDSEKGYSQKCDFCRLLLDKGEPPACVAACTCRALDFGELQELKEKHGDLNTLAPLPEDVSTGPSMVFTPSRLNPDGALVGEITNPEEELL